MNDLIFLDLFSGIGGFPLAFKKVGFTIKEHYYSEIDKHAIANYKFNFKNAKYAGSVQSIQPEDIPNPNIITFGSPCQDFSISGKRKGLDGDRSSLISQAIRLITAKKPDIFIWENVKGTFSTNNGADFWAIIQAFANIGGYELQWQLVNTKWILPQNRERIYLIGLLATGGRNRQKIFPLTKNDFIHYQHPITNQSQTENSATIGTKFGQRKENTYIQYDPLKTGNKSQQNRIYKPDGIMNCIPSQRTDDKIKIFSTMPRNGNPKIGGTGFLQKNDITYCLYTKNSQAIKRYAGIRKLTEIEAERLQGFPDDWTKYGIYNNTVKEIAMTNRYSLIGNAVTTLMVEIIAKKLLK